MVTDSHSPQKPPQPSLPQLSPSHSGSQGPHSQVPSSPQLQPGGQGGPHCPPQPLLPQTLPAQSGVQQSLSKQKPPSSQHAPLQALKRQEQTPSIHCALSPQSLSRPHSQGTAGIQTPVASQLPDEKQLPSLYSQAAPGLMGCAHPPSEVHRSVVQGSPSSQSMPVPAQIMSPSR